jgi:PAS domain S-box-containing protein
MKTTSTGSTTAQGLHRLVAEGTSDLQTVVSADGTYRFLSATGLGSFGWSPGDLVGEQQVSFTHPEDESLVADTHGQLLAGLCSTATTVQRFRCQDGTFPSLSG